MRIKNTTNGGRGIGVASAKADGAGQHIEWAPGEIKDIDDAVIARAKKDPTNAGMLTEEGGLVEVTTAASKAQAATEAEEKAEREGAKK